MKRLLRPVILIGISLIFALFSAAITRSSPPMGQENLSAGAIFLQSTTTPQVVDVSEVGSTDGIVVMGIVITLIVIIPIFIRRKSWTHPE